METPGGRSSHLRMRSASGCLEQDLGSLSAGWMCALTGGVGGPQDKWEGAVSPVY